MSKKIKKLSIADLYAVLKSDNFVKVRGITKGDCKNELDKRIWKLK
tara:strand:+ start:225 stop:362 length:138 start_codon:yes stop_codon:yes gene_type:complete